MALQAAARQMEFLARVSLTCWSRSPGWWSAMWPEPSEKDLRLVEAASRVVAIAIQRHEVEEGREQNLESLIRHMAEGVAGLPLDEAGLPDPLVKGAAAGLPPREGLPRAAHLPPGAAGGGGPRLAGLERPALSRGVAIVQDATALGRLQGGGSMSAPRWGWAPPSASGCRWRRR
ncbi:MAG: hypothetical protein ACOY93_13470 [Bacillota bacterium]